MSKKAIVISGGGSKGAFACGVSQYLMEQQGKSYDIYVGSSTGSLITTILALDNMNKLRASFARVNQKSIFSVNPFVVRKRKGQSFIGINYFNIFLQQIRGKRTFGESKNLRRLIRKNFTYEDYHQIKKKNKNVIVTVSNLTKNRVEYKSINEFKYSEFCDWIWISCNYIPFMSLAVKNGMEYADGGFGSVVPIREAILRGAKEVDVIILDHKKEDQNLSIGRNPFSLMTNLFAFMWDQVEQSDIRIGELAAKYRDVKLNLYYTPTKLTDNSLVFNKKQMQDWWQQGFDYARNKNEKELPMNSVDIRSNYSENQ